MPYAPRFTEQENGHRAAPSGFSAYTPDKVTDLGIYMLSTGESYTERLIRYIDRWFAYFNAVPDKNYTVYGYMPKAEGMSSSLSSVTSGGATMTISGMKPVTSDDICIVTGVKETDIGLQEGQFGWYMATANDNFHMYLLMDHLYASVKFSMKIHEDYAVLRTVKVKTMKLKVNAASVDAEVTLTHNTVGESPITGNVNYTTTGSSYEAEIFNDEEGQALSTVTPMAVTACFAPSFSSNLTLVTTYDVYDSKGNLIRANCTATNKLPALGARRGERVQVNMMVSPTYLYVLSDKDLDNLIVIQ
jgi:hypothetical protein